MALEEVTNYVSIKGINPFFKKFAHVDTLDYYANQLFINNKLNVKPEEKYIFVLCRVRRLDSDIFVRVMAELVAKVLLCGKNDYYVGCERICNILGMK